MMFHDWKTRCWKETLEGVLGVLFSKNMHCRQCKSGWQLSNEMKNVTMKSESYRGHQTWSHINILK